MQHIVSRGWRFGLLYGLLGICLASLLAACGSDTVPSAATPTIGTQTTTEAVTTAATTTTQAATTAAATTQSSLPTVTPLPTTAAATTVAATTAPATTVFVNQDATTAATQPVTTNTPTTAAPTTAPATKPASSGKLRLAYVVGGKLHVLDPATKEDKTPGNLTVMGRPDWSPDGNTLVVTKSSKSGELYLLDLAGGTEKALTSGANDNDPRFSPDGKLILFTRLVAGRTELWLVDSNGQNPRKLTNGQQGAWGPDSQRIAFVTDGTGSNGQFTHNNALHLINVKGQNEWEPASAAKLPTDLSAQGFPFGPSTQAVQYPTWLDGGRTIGFTTIGHSGLLVTVSSTSAKDVKVWDTQYEGGFGATDSTTQGSWLVYETFPPSGFMGISLMNTAGTPNLAQPNNVSIDNPKQGVLAARPALSPDGSRLAYLKLGKEAASSPDDQPFNGTLTIVQVKGGQVSSQQEFGKGQISALAWSK